MAKSVGLPSFFRPAGQRERDVTPITASPGDSLDRGGRSCSRSRGGEPLFGVFPELRIFSHCNVQTGRDENEESKSSDHPLEIFLESVGQNIEQGEHKEEDPIIAHELAESPEQGQEKSGEDKNLLPLFVLSPRRSDAHHDDESDKQRLDARICLDHIQWVVPVGMLEPRHDLLEFVWRVLQRRRDHEVPHYNEGKQADECLFPAIDAEAVCANRYNEDDQPPAQVHGQENLAKEQ